MELATFTKLFSGSAYAVVCTLFIAAAPFVPPGRAVAVAELPGVYGPLRPVSSSVVNEADLTGPGRTDTLSFRTDGSAWYRVRLSDGDRTYRFRGRVYEEWGSRVLDLIPEEDLGWDGKTAGSHLLIGFSFEGGELRLREIGGARRVFQFYRLKKG
ncbi:hypothetical protein EPO15_03615 [bacterium]|nr:MAG: hypothetical protein EPO15_03615 [bacterium]